MDKIKIIWVDDNLELLKTKIPLFEENHFEVIAANTIAAALSHVLNGESENILLDVDFPGNPKEGILFLEQLKTINPNINVVLLTGFSEEDERVQLLRKRVAEDYISKPIPKDNKKLHDFFVRLKESFNQSSSLKDFKRTKLDLLVKSLNYYEIKNFINIFKSIFANLSYDIKVRESSFHGFFQIILDLIGLHVESEVQTNNGRIDCVVKVENFIYIIEFKLKN